MANTTVKGKFNVVAENGDVQTIYPKTTGDQVLVDRSSNASVIPNDVANLQHIVNKMGVLALKSKVETSDFTTGTMISSLEDLKSNTDTGKIADATVVKDIESRVDTLENSNLVTVDELDAGLATKPDTEINDSVTSTSLTWSSKKLSDQLTTLNSNSNLLDTRVNTLITHNNDTEGNSELIDIRTGADGMTYASAGNAVRIPLQKLRADFESVAVVTADNTFVDTDFDNMIADKYMTKNGTEGTQIDGCYGAITVHTGEKYKIKAEVGTNIRTYVIKNASGTVTRFPDAETFNTKHNYDVEITITSDEDGGTLFVSTIHADYIGLKKASRVCMIDKDKINGLPDFSIYDAAVSSIQDIETDIDSITYNVYELQSTFIVSETYENTDFDDTIDDKYMSKGGTEGGYAGGCYGAIAVHTGEKYKIKAEVGTNIRTYVINDASGTVTRFADAETFNTKHNYDVEITITSDEDGGTLFVSTIHADYIGLKKVSRVYMIDKDKINGLPDFSIYDAAVSSIQDIETNIDSITYNVDELQSSFNSVTIVSETYENTDFDDTIDDKYMSKNGTESSYSGGCYGAIAVHTGEKYKIKAEVGTNIRTYVIKNASGTVTRFADKEAFNTKHNYDVEITIASDEDGGTLFVSTIHADYIGLKKSSRVYMIDKDKIEDFPINPLYGKTALFNGDSICAGLSVGSSDPTYGYGWAGRIGTKNKMTWKNYGVSGGTVTTDTYNWTSVPASSIDYSSGNKYYRRVGSSASGTDTMYVEVPESQWDGTSSLYSRGKARYWESSSIDTLYSEYPDADYIILESCLNDGFNGVPKGTITNDNFSPSSTTTFASAMEYMINRTITLFPNAKIGVIIPHRVSADNLNDYHEIARSVCEKWGIPYIDLYKQSGLCVKNPTQKAVMFADNTHLKAAGYDMITDKIEAWMKTL